MACICPINSESTTPGYTKIPCRVALDLGISSALSPFPMGTWTSGGTLCTFKVLIIIGIEVETSILADPLVLPVSWSHKLAQGCGKIFVSSFVFLSHSVSSFPGT